VPNRSSILSCCVVAAALCATPALAEPDKRFGVGLVLTDDRPHDPARSTVKVRPFFRMRNERGLHPAFGLNWVTLDFDQDAANPTAPEGRLRMRPLLAGASYTWITKLMSVSPRAFGGYSFNRFRSAQGHRAANSIVAKVELQLWHDLNARLGIVGSIGYLVARPNVAQHALKADDLRLQVGLAYAVY
jgi:hypothetical protein